jgi:leucyl aminopeptidase
MKGYKLFILILAMNAFTVSSVFSNEKSKEIYISIDSDALKFSEKTFGNRISEVRTSGEISILKIDEDAIPWLSRLMHSEFERCGGFMVHDDEVDALDLLASQDGAQL